MFLIISPKPFKLQRCTIPHFKPLDPLFWPLAWLLTLGSIIFGVWSKTFVNFFMGHPRVSLPYSRIFLVKGLLTVPPPLASGYIPNKGWPIMKCDIDSEKNGI